MQLRILHVIPRLEWGSAERQVAAIARECRDRFDVHVVTCAATDAMRSRLQGDDATLHILPSSRFWSGPPLARWHAIIRALRPNIVHCWRLRHTWPIAVWTATGTQAKLVVDLRLPDKDSEWFNQNGQRWATRMAATRVVPQDMPGRAGEWGPWTVIPDQVDESFFTEAQTSRPSKGPLRKELGLGHESKIILFVGRLLLRKHLEELIWSADLLKVVRDDTYVAIIGEGADRPRLERFRDQIEIRDRVRFLGARYDIPQCMREAHCLWSASDDEDLPLSVIEAQAVGLPVVASDIEAHRQWIESDRTGILVPWGDNAARVRQTMRILDDSPYSESLAEEAKRQLQQKRETDENTKRYIELYESPW